MKLIGSLKDLYIGINHNDWNYCIVYIPKQYRMKEHFGFNQSFYDGIEILDIDLYFFNISKVYDY